MLKIKNKRAGMALSQIILLLVGTIAIAYAFGSEIGVVSGLNINLKTGPGGSAQTWTYDSAKEIWTTSGSEEFITKGNMQGVIDSYGTTTGQGAATNPTTGGGAGKKGDSWYSDIFGFGEGVNPKTGEVGAGGDWLSSGNFLDGFISAASWGVAAYSVTLMVGPMLGLDETQTDAAARALGWGFFAGKGVANLIQRGIWNYQTAGVTKYPGMVSPGAAGFWVGLLVTWMVYRSLYKEYSYRVVTFNSLLWQAPTSGSHCEECNNQEFPCSEYQCRSLGQSCELLNEEDSGEQFCAWVNKNDVKAPEINTWAEPLLAGYRYTPDSATAPPDKGVVIESTTTTDKCIPAFTALAFGIVLDEPGVCKVDYNRTSFEEMQFFFGGNQGYAYNHTQIMSLPGKANADGENLTLYNNGNFGVFVKCMDRAGNQNENDFVFKFCVEKGPDTTAPFVIGTSILNGMPVAFGQSSINFDLYINEPAECRWSHDDKSYDNMVEQMTCATHIRDSTEFNAQIAYKCTTNLTGIQDKKENKFYFRCKDNPAWQGTSKEGDRNINAESLPTSAGFTIIGTQPLVIDEVGPGNQTIKDSAIAVKVTLTAETSAGYNEGESVCSYAEEGDDLYVDFFNTSSYTHSTDLYLPEGEYTYNIRCVDAGGNSDSAKIDFETESDSEAPEIVRAYREENSLKIITDEPSECVYDTKSCTYLFDDGLPMTTTGNSTHYIDWSTKTKFYIKCRDEYGNEAAPDECTAIIRAIEN